MSRISSNNQEKMQFFSNPARKQTTTDCKNFKWICLSVHSREEYNQTCKITEMNSYFYILTKKGISSSLSKQKTSFHNKAH